MKIVFFLLLSICVLPLTISAPSPLIRLPTEPASPVLDTDGNAVVGGAKYFARFTKLGSEGGISLTDFSNSGFCPTDVYLNSSIITYPPQPRAILRPIIFHPLNDPTGVVYVADPINVEFYETNPVDPCPTNWKLDENFIVAASVPSTFSIRFSDSPSSYIFTGIDVVDDLKRLGTANTTIFDFHFDKLNITGD